MSPIRRRTAEERATYVEGFEAGARSALDAVRRLNFSDVAERAWSYISVTLSAITESSQGEPGVQGRIGVQGWSVWQGDDGRWRWSAWSLDGSEKAGAEPTPAETGRAAQHAWEQLHG